MSFVIYLGKIGYDSDDMGIVSYEKKSNKFQNIGYSITREINILEK